ncbi:PiggyBac transposable element-derived protein 4 [Dictyocoela muelleri]|nr:PiggyBac transposable element-derived protein 4 [Dictyocoela muelleri]
MIKYYPLKLESNRWTQKFTCHVFKIIFHNSYILYKQFNNEKKNSHYNFTEKIINYLIEKSQIDKKVNTPEKNLSKFVIILLRLLKVQTVFIAVNFSLKDQQAILNVKNVTFSCA